MDHRGFTLMELLIVLVIMAMLFGAAIPRLQTLYRSGVIAFEKADIRGQIGGLGYKAYVEKKAIKLSNELSSLPINLPEGWTIETTKPIVYQFNGICSGGKLTVINGSITESWELVPPFCQPE